jgi:hypothetical protein
VGLLVLGLAALLDNVGVLQLAAYHYVAVALTVSGVALLVGAWWGRARGFIAVGLLLIPVLLVMSAVGGPWGWGADVGQRFVQPQSTAELADSYRMLAGELQLDLTALDPADEHVSLDASVFAGDVLIVVPDDVNVVASGRAAAGEVHLFDEVTSGLGVARTVSFMAEPDAATYDLETRVGFGRLRIVHAHPLSPRSTP